jgi:hypothetical protein
MGQKEKYVKKKKLQTPQGKKPLGRYNAHTEG